MKWLVKYGQPGVIMKIYSLAECGCGRVEEAELRWICHPLHVASRAEEEMD